MIMLGIWFAKDIPDKDGSPRSLANSVPFREVYIHALVRDANREKMSKTKGNVVDPIEIVKQYGTDAVRFTLASMASPGTDIAFNIARTEGYRAFANKIWNAARFIFQNVDRAHDSEIRIEPSYFAAEPNLKYSSSVESRWIIYQLNLTASRVHKALGEYRFDDAANATYKFFWSQFCDWYLEVVKLRLDFNRNASAEEELIVLLYVFESSLRLLSPFMPFITEQIWQNLYEGNPPHKSIALANYPSTNWFPERVSPGDDVSEIQGPRVAIAKKGADEMDKLQLAITAIRARRKEINVEEKAFVSVKVAADDAIHSILSANLDIIQKLAKADNLEFVSIQDRYNLSKYADLAWQAFVDFDLFVDYKKQIDVAAERDRLTKDIAKYEKGLAAAERQLGNEAFLKKAPPQVVEGLKKQEAETRLLLEKARAALANLPPSGAQEEP
jgi:valyl-tRNA synthetase